MRRVGAFAACAALAVAMGGCPSDDGDTAAATAFERFVESWAPGGRSLARTVTGADVDELTAAVEALRSGGVVRVSLRDVSEVDGVPPSLEGVVALGFADGGELRLTSRVRIEDDRVLAAPAAVSTKLSGWEPLRIDAFGDPVRGDVLSRGGTVLAHGPEGARTVASPGVAAAVALIDEALDDRLGARRGRRLVAGEGRVVAESAPADGDDVTVSLDDGLQAAAEQALRNAPGALVAVDPRTGGIRALASNPERGTTDGSPASSAFSPGSAFKIVTAAAALEEGVLAVDDEVRCPARISVGERDVSNFEGQAYGSITFEKAFAVSCNTAFAQIGIDLGTGALLATANRLGFRVVPDLDGPGTMIVPRSRGELAVWSFGAAGSLASPVQMTGLVATVASGGRSVTPAWTDEGRPGERVLEEDTATALVTMMEEVVETGTGRLAAVPGARIAGKTGTADRADGGSRSDAWFVGLAPSRDTSLVVVAFRPGAGIGGEAAAPIAREFLLATRTVWEPQ